MKPTKATLALLLVLGAVQFLAAGSARAVTTLNANQIKNLLVGKYACGSSGTEKWDEILAGTNSGSVTDYKKGPSDPRDPSAVVGSYTINNQTNTITYNYTSGGSYTYTIEDPNSNYPNPGIYIFVGPQTLTITVATSHCL